MKGKLRPRLKSNKALKKFVSAPNANYNVFYSNANNKSKSASQIQSRRPQKLSKAEINQIASHSKAYDYKS